MILYLDTETFSPTPITAGVARYAEQAEVIILTYAWDDGPVELIEFPDAFTVRGLIDCADEVVIHNAAFDTTVLRIALGVDIPPDKVRCTMAQALAHGLPGSLDMLCAIFRLEQAKLKEGKALIQLFCKPQPERRSPRTTAREHDSAWQRFCAYARQDVNALRELSRKLPVWNWRPQPHFDERAVCALDQVINRRGVAIDVALAEGAVEVVQAAQAAVKRRAAELTGGRFANLKARDETLLQLFIDYGEALPDLRASTLERRLEDEQLPEELREILRLRLVSTTVSTAKYQALLRATSSDGRLRNTLQYCGAARTGRWAGRTFQPQNLPRTPDAFDEAAQAAAVERFVSREPWSDPAEAVEQASWCLRGALVAGPGHKLIAADLSNIEGRVAAWIAGETWKLEAFAAFDRGEGHDLYKITAGRILNKPPEDVTKAERQVQGKVSELALGYQGAVGAFSAMAAAYGLDVAEEEALSIVKQWRRANSKIASYWYELDDAVRSTITGGVEVVVREAVAVERWRGWLKVILPSGRALSYAKPAITERGEIVYQGIHQLTRQWTEIKTYGGKLFENICQATARDILACGMLDAEAVGLRPVLSVHDEVICEPPDDDFFDVDLLVEQMTRPRRWIEGIPLAAAGFEAQRYRK